MKYGTKIIPLALVLLAGASLPMLMGPTGGIPSILNIQKITLKRAHSGDFNSPLSLESSSPSIQLRETDAAANEKYYQHVVGSGDYAFQAVSDAGAIHNVLSVTRSGVNVSQIDFGNDSSSPAPAYFFNGIGRVTFEGAPLISNNGPTYYWQENDAAVDEKIWRAVMSGGDLFIGTQDDSFGGGENGITATRSGTAITNINLASDDVQVNGVTILPISGTVNVTPLGCTTSPSWTLKYYRIGPLVTLYSANLVTCTSNAATFQLDGLPATLWSANMSTACIGIDNSAGAAAMCVASDTDRITLLASQESGAGILTYGNTWTASGSKGLQQGWSLTYYRD